MNSNESNTDPAEIAKFEAVAARWWDPAGENRPLLEMNPVRLAYIDECCTLTGKAVVDIGCGGGILAESMARSGAKVTGIDMAPAALEAARIHLADTDLNVDYRLQTAEELAQASPAAFDVVTCMELLEHVPDPASVIAAAAALVRPGGHVFFATINRNPKAYALAVIGAEYLLKMLPRGTHEYARFIRPSELAGWARTSGLVLSDMTGMHYNPLTRVSRLGGDVDVNYIMHFKRQGA